MSLVEVVITPVAVSMLSGFSTELMIIISYTDDVDDFSCCLLFTPYKINKYM
jgi:hypothetical protein